MGMMTMSDDMTLVRQYADLHSEEAFAAIVSRYINPVYSVALRQVRDAHQAEEITQVVFIILARKAGSLGPKTIVAGWLCRAARNVSARSLLMQQRRQRREQEASYMQSISTEPEAMAWNQIEPMLDAALGQLGGKDHAAVVLRFLDGKSFKEVGAALGASEDTAKKRVSRALEKLRRFFTKRGITLSTAVIAGIVSANSTQAAPAALAKAVTAAAVAQGATVGGSTLALLRGTLKFMAWSKYKTALIAVAAILAAIPPAVMVAPMVERYYKETQAWRFVRECIIQRHWRIYPALPEMVSLRPSMFAGRWKESFSPDVSSGSMLELDDPAASVFGHAYHISGTRIVNPEMLPKGEFDFIVKVPDHPFEALQGEIKKRFGLQGVLVIRQTEVLVMTVAKPDAPALKRSVQSGAGFDDQSGIGQVKLSNATMTYLSYYMEHWFNMPVVDETGMTGGYDVDFEWNRFSHQPDEFKREVLDQLGFELTPGVQTIQMLKIEKAR